MNPQTQTMAEREADAEAAFAHHLIVARSETYLRMQADDEDSGKPKLHGWTAFAFMPGPEGYREGNTLVITGDFPLVVVRGAFASLAGAIRFVAERGHRDYYRAEKVVAGMREHAAHELIAGWDRLEFADSLRDWLDQYPKTRLPGEADDGESLPAQVRSDLSTLLSDVCTTRYSRSAVFDMLEQVVAAHREIDILDDAMTWGNCDGTAATLAVEACKRAKSLLDLLCEHQGHWCLELATEDRALNLHFCTVHAAEHDNDEADRHEREALEKTARAARARAEFAAPRLASEVAAAFVEAAHAEGDDTPVDGAEGEERLLGKLADEIDAVFAEDEAQCEFGADADHRCPEEGTEERHGHHLCPTHAEQHDRLAVAMNGAAGCEPEAAESDASNLLTPCDWHRCGKVGATSHHGLFLCADHMRVVSGRLCELTVQEKGAPWSSKEYAQRLREWVLDHRYEYATTGDPRSMKPAEAIPPAAVADLLEHALDMATNDVWRADVFEEIRRIADEHGGILAFDELSRLVDGEQVF